MPSLFILLIIVGGYAAFYFGDARLHAILKQVGLAVVAGVALRWAMGRVAERIRVARHRRRLERLQAFADHVEKGTIDGRGFYSGGTATVAGVFEGRGLELVIRRERPPVVAYELRLREDAVELDVMRPGIVARLSGVRLVAPRPELEDPLRHLFLEHGLARVCLFGGWLRAEKRLADRDLRLDRLLAVYRSLSRIARLCQRGPALAGLRVAGSDAGERRCPYCREPILDGGSVEACRHCRTAHHAECFAEAGGCTVLGCPGRPAVRLSRQDDRGDLRKATPS